MMALAVTMVAAMCPQWARAQFSGSGTGTESDPYLIYNQDQLAQVGNFLDQEGVVFELKKDLDLSTWIAENSPSQGWTPIGVESAPFKGVFKGNNHTISGVFINRPTIDYVGFFGSISGATIRDVVFKATYITGKNRVGAFVGYAYNNSTISNVTITITGNSGVTGASWVGGVVGRIESSTISNSSYKGNLNSTTTDVGGIAGYASASTISGCNTQFTLSGITTVGGVVGNLIGSTIQNTIGTGNITASSSNAGGIVAYGTGTSTITCAKHTGDIIGVLYVGGVVGNISSGSITIDQSHSKGKITNTGDYTGGVVGYSAHAGIEAMTDCSHFGDIVGVNYVGGLVGMINSNTDEAQPYYQASSGTAATGTQYYCTIQAGATITKDINNCTAICNLNGNNYVGGLIGQDITGGVTYTYVSHNGGSIRAGDNTYKYLYRNGIRVYSYGGSGDFYPLDKANYTIYALTNSYYSGNIEGQEYVGGIVGYKKNGSITNCYSQATSIIGKQNVGGIAGLLTNSSTVNYPISTIVKSNVAINSTISASEANVGRIYGLIEGNNVIIGALGSNEGNRALAQTCMMLCGVAQDVIDNDQQGNAIGPSSLKLKANYVAYGWDFNNDWDIQETECYPYKRYQAAPPVIESDLVSHNTVISGNSLNGGSVFLFYKDHDAVMTTCNGHSWSFDTEDLQSGANVRLYADVDSLVPSYLTLSKVKYPGSGTEDDPYRIYTAEDLQGATNSGYFKLMNDIDLTDWIEENSPVTGWQPIGRNSTAATYIDGDGHTVWGLWINTTENYTGLFSNYSAGYIKDLNVEVNYNVRGNKTGISGGDYTGILIGCMRNGQIINCNVGEEHVVISASNHTGLLVGSMTNGEILNCNATGIVLGEDYTALLTGDMNGGQIVNCTVKGRVTGGAHVGGITGKAEQAELRGLIVEGRITSTAESSYTGGIAGHNVNVNMDHCQSKANVTANGESSCVGGLVGKAEGGSITKCNTQTTIDATGNYVGGLVGYSSSPINLCFSKGSITSTGDDTEAGGLVGRAEAAISNCYSTAAVTGKRYTGGLVGYTFSSIDNCYAQGDVYGVMYGAGVVGELDGSNASINNCVALNNTLSLSDKSSWGCRVIGGYKNGAAEPEMNNYALSTMQVSLNGVPQTKTDDNIEGVAKSLELLQQKMTYEVLGWDFATTWGITQGVDYPYLLWVNTDSAQTPTITLDKHAITMAKGETVQITATIMPESAASIGATWTSSNEGVATVDNQGNVTAIAAGTATIVATTNDASRQKDQCEVTVVENVINQISLADVTANSGDTVTVAISLTNQSEVTGLQADIYLQTGLNFVIDSEGYYDITLSDRATRKHVIDFNQQSDGSIRIITYTPDSRSFTGNDGELIYVKVAVSGYIEDGDFAVEVKNVEMAAPDGTQTYCPDASALVHVISFPRGDANGDHNVSVTDAVVTSNYILGNPTPSFVFVAADVNCDKKISVADVVLISNIILGKPTYTFKAPRMLTGSEMLSADDFALTSGETRTVAVDLLNVYNYTAMQMDITLPIGVEVSDIRLSERASRHHTISFNQTEDGHVKVIAFATDNSLFTGYEGDLLYIDVKGNNNLSESGTLQMSDIYFCESDGTTHELSPLSINVNNSTGIIEIPGTDNELVNVYNMQGQLVKKGVRTQEAIKGLASGCYLVGNKKIYVK